MAWPVPDDGLTIHQRFYRKHKDRLNAERHVYRLKYVYGMEESQYWDLYNSQGGRCAICQQPGKGRRQFPLDVDHSHGSGEVRGLLCVGCNTRLHALENTQWREIADAYLARHRK